MMKSLLFIPLIFSAAPRLCASPSVPPELPNVLLIVADDLGYGDLGCYGSTVHETPHIDALAANGMRFTDFHSAGAMCSPTRASLLTGCYPQRFGTAFDGALSGANGRSDGLPLEAVTVAEALKESGYATACFGKWHLGYEAPLLPNRQGFDVFRGLLSGDGDFHTHVDRSGNEDWFHNEELVKEDGYTTDLLTRHAVDFIEARKDGPFFLYLPHLAIHFPWQGPDDPPHRQAGQSYHKDKWGIIPDPENVASHVKAMVESLDEGVGRLMEVLRRLSLDDNTLVIFTSDNGGYLNYGTRFQNISSNGIYRGQKTELYEGGHRVPMIASWPGRIEPGVSDALTHSNDLMPTLLALAGVEAPDHDGVDWGPLLMEGKALPDRQLFWRTRSAHAVRSGAWKLCAVDQRVELYHLGEDPGEQVNRVDEEPAIVERLSAAWQVWNTDVNRSAEPFEK